MPVYLPRDRKDEVMRKILHGKSPYQHIDRQTHYLHNVQRELDARQSKMAYASNREELLQHQRKVNRYIEHHRIMGMLSNPRLDIGSRENLERRRKKLESLGVHNK
jgi:transcriptional regulator of NAD metabolism